MGWFISLLRPTGLPPRMTAEQMADSNIELGKLVHERELGPVLDDITVPVRYVLSSETSTDLDPVFERKPNIQLSAKVTSNGAILKKDPAAIARAVREVAALDGGER